MAPTRKEQNPESLNHDLDKLSPIIVHGPLQQNRFQVPSGEKANISSTKPQAIKTSRLFYDDDVDPLPVSLRPWVNNDTVEVPAPQVRCPSMQCCPSFSSPVLLLSPFLLSVWREPMCVVCLLTVACKN